MIFLMIFIIFDKYIMQSTKTSILCPICGIKFIPDESNICNACVLASVQEVQILKGDTIQYCRFCSRFNRPPWMHCQRQSVQMLSTLLKKVKNLSKVKMTDAKFVWTQPHSKRMKIKIVYQKQISQDMKVQQTQVVEFVEIYTQCSDCKKQFTPHEWNYIIQVRQPIHHKRTLLALEQIIINTKIDKTIMKVEDVQNGIDFFFKTLGSYEKFVDFLKRTYPIKIKTSKQFISHDERNNTSNVKTTASISLPKICKDDLVWIPNKLSKQLGSCSVLLLCLKVASNVYLLDVVNYHKITISAQQYFHYEQQMQFFSLKVFGKQFQVLDCQENKKYKPNHIQHQVWDFTIMKTDQFKQIYTKSHFPIQCGNDVQGYDLTINEDFQAVKNVPDVIIVKKYKSKEQKAKNRKLIKQARKQREKSEISSIKPKKQDKQEEQQDQLDLDKQQQKLTEQLEKVNIQKLNENGEDSDEWEDVEEPSEKPKKKH